MNLEALAADLASRVGPMSEDNPINNARLILGLLQNEFKTQWQPIETAPRDGTAILAIWITPKMMVGDNSYDVAMFYRGSWTSAEDNPDDIFGEPSFWMPLPPPPQ